MEQIFETEMFRLISKITKENSKSNIELINLELEVNKMPRTCKITKEYRKHIELFPIRNKCLRNLQVLNGKRMNLGSGL